MKINNVSHIGYIQPKSKIDVNKNISSNFLGFFNCTVATCATIEEGLKSFEDLEDRRKRRYSSVNEQE